MTIRERDILDRLCDKLHEYHVEVKQFATKVETHDQRLSGIELDLRGNPENREDNPGIMSQVADLRKSRKISLSILAGAWTLATILFGTFIAWVTGK